MCSVKTWKTFETESMHWKTMKTMKVDCRMCCQHAYKGHLTYRPDKRLLVINLFCQHVIKLLEF